MKIIQMKLKDMKPYDKNPRKNDNAVDMVANSIREFGFKVPIIVDRNNTIVAGHTRYKAAKKLGLKEVPVIIADDLTDEQIKAFRLADNKVSEIATWDYELLEHELQFIQDLDMQDFGFISFEDETMSLIDDLLENEFTVRKTDAEEFSMTFVFNKKYENQIKNYISEFGKEKIVEEIIKLTEAK